MCMWMRVRMHAFVRAYVHVFVFVCAFVARSGCVVKVWTICIVFDSAFTYAHPNAQVNRFLGPLLYISWTLIGFFLLLNMFVAILNDAIDEVPFA